MQPSALQIVHSVLAAVLVVACASASPATVAPGTIGPDGMRVCATEAEQTRMQAYIDGLYDQRFVRTQVMIGDDQVDCIDFDKQPGCQHPEVYQCPHEPPTPPPAPPGPPPGQGPGAGPGSPAPVTLPPAPVPIPNPMVSQGGGCPAGTIPITRPKIEILRHFCTLEDYFRK